MDSFLEVMTVDMDGVTVTVDMDGSTWMVISQHE